MDRFEAVETNDDNHVAGWVQTTDNVKLWVNIQGRGRPIVLIHGWTMSSRFWRRQAALSESFQVITLDLRGHGRSNTTLRGNTIPRYARDVREVITALGLTNVTLMGWSLGGAIVLDYWQQYASDRLAAIGIIEAAPAPMTSAPWNTHRYNGQAMDTVYADLTAMTADRSAFANRFINAMFLAGQAPHHALQWMQAEHMITTDQTATTLYEDYAPRDYTPILPTVTVPTLVLYGRSRHMCYGPSTGRYVAGSIPDSRFVILEKSGHMPFYEEPDEFNQAVAQFMNQQS